MVEGAAEETAEEEEEEDAGGCSDIAGIVDVGGLPEHA